MFVSGGVTAKIKKKIENGEELRNSYKNFCEIGVFFSNWAISCDGDEFCPLRIEIEKKYTKLLEIRNLPEFSYITIMGNKTIPLEKTNLVLVLMTFGPSLPGHWPDSK